MINGNLSLCRGDDQDVGINVTNPDGSYYNLSGCTILFNARKDTNYYSPVILSKTVTGHYGAASGASMISFTSGDTFGLDNVPYFFDIKLISANNKVTTLIAGNLIMYPK